MARIFDRDTLLDLTVNFVPLGIIAFFIALFLLIDPWRGLGVFGTVLMIGLHAMPFVGLGVLTYIAGKAIAGDEQRSSVFYQGQATLEGARTKEEFEADIEDADLGKAEAAAEDVQAERESMDESERSGSDDGGSGAEATEPAGNDDEEPDAEGAEAAAEAADEKDRDEPNPGEGDNQLSENETENPER